MREADGFSFARAVAFQIVLAAFPALIFFVGVSARTARSSVLVAVLGGLAFTAQLEAERMRGADPNGSGEG